MNFRHKISSMILLVLIVVASTVFTPSAIAQDVNHTATISIPSIDVNASVVPVFVRQFSYGTTWDVSNLYMNVGFFEGLPWFGIDSNIVLGGHSTTSTGQPDIFYRLDEVQAGDSIIITIAGSDRHYVVSEIYWVSQFDLSPIYPTKQERLTLITCDVGSYNTNSGTYDNRVVVVALPVS